MRTSNTTARKPRRSKDELARLDFEKSQPFHEAADWDEDDLGLAWDESEARSIATALAHRRSPQH